MGAHGKCFPLTYQIVSKQVANEALSPEGDTLVARPVDRPNEPPSMPGLRRFLGEPEAARRFKIDNSDPCSNMDRLHTLMARLARRMSNEFRWPSHSNLPPGIKPPKHKWENPFLPAGYTYLLQLVGHDLVHTTAPVSMLQSTATGLRNDQRFGLKLDTVYGGGPLVCPFAYELDDGRDETRTKLRLMRMRWKDKTTPPDGPYRDIARLETKHLSGVDRSDFIGPGQGRLTEPLIPDPRNDDHVILSQLVTVFHHLHNGLIDKLPERDAKVAARSIWEAAHERYLCARGAVTLIYRNVIRRDLLRRLLHPEIYDAYNVRKPLFLDRPDRAVTARQTPNDTPVQQFDSRVPLEFSHAAFRLGHAMVRDEYDINGEKQFEDTFKLSSAKRPGRLPLDETWIIRWSQFFTINGSAPNLSRRIGPQYSDGFLAIFPQLDQQTKQAGLAFRDLMSGGLLGLWSVDALIEKIAASRPEFIKLSPLLSDRPRRVTRLTEWLTSGHNKLAEASDVATLANDPPLLLFVLLEAAFDDDAPGLRLGVLGSIIVAEVIFGTLMRDPLRSETEAETLHDALAALSNEIYRRNYFADVPEIETMSQMIEYTADIANLRNAKPPFV
jgi:heme peroxidase